MNFAFGFVFCVHYLSIYLLLYLIHLYFQLQFRRLKKSKLSSMKVKVLIVWPCVALLCCLVAAVSAKTSKPHVSRKGNSNPIDGLPSVYVTLMI
jgi:hypothetical protein